MKTTQSGDGVKVAKVVTEMLSIINSKGLFTHKCKLLRDVETAGRPGKDEALDLRDAYIRKFVWYQSRHILGRCPRGIEQYGHKVRNDYHGLVLIGSEKWENRFAHYIESLYQCLECSLIPVFQGYQFRGKRAEANQIRATHMAKIEALKPESERRKAEREEAHRKAKATSYNAELTEYLQANFPYRMATGKWAGGNTEITAWSRIGYESEAKGLSQRAWSDNGKWSGLNAEYRFFINSLERCIVIGGLVTSYPSQYENKPVKPCVWWEQSRGFELVRKSGFLVGGYHTEAQTAEAAIAAAKASQRYSLKRDSQVLTPDFVHRKWGFCMPGIRNFMAQNGITAESITVAGLRNIVVANRKLNCRLYRTHLAKMGITLNCH
jgi:hypothetical protein